MIYRLTAAAGAVLVGSVAVVSAGAAMAQIGGRSVTAAHAALTPQKAHSGPLPGLPRVSYEPPRPWAVIQQVYEFAARHPEVLQFVPCYCGCERVGHTANHSCFVKSRAADGRVSPPRACGAGVAARGWDGPRSNR